MPKLEDELTASGCEMDAETFRRTLVDLFAETFANWTDEDLLCNPDEAKRFCNLIRHRVGNQRLTDYVILRTLTNLRKRSSLAVSA